MLTSSEPTLGRRAFMAALPLAGIPTGELHAAHADLAKLPPAETVRTYIKLIGSTESAVVYTWFTGHLWIIVPSRPPAPLVSFQGLAKNIWAKESNGVVTQQNFDVGFFGAADGGGAIDEVENPLTGEIVNPYHYMYGGGIQRYSDQGKLVGNEVTPIRPNWIVSGDMIWVDESRSASALNPIEPASWPRESAGEQVHFGSATSLVANASELLDPSRSSVPYTLFWSSIGSWEPWLHMGASPGYIMWRAVGRKLADLSEASEEIRAYVREVQPNYLADGPPWEGTKSTWNDFMRDRKPAA